ncbi:hypothetical protein ABD91_25655 [Lysinibacillus sphaericus]|uniref:hypothetical protein n=1 Tax=Lysinibacillus sphaericus TaxID=1421 RepID=UPI0018CD71ED|nr:hypothetical protein [Lysinibacillus sphaericus]MBG9694130.1 hypothetical protein [Lysinibacillus sphaericus]
MSLVSFSTTYVGITLEATTHYPLTCAKQYSFVVPKLHAKQSGFVVSKLRAKQEKAVLVLLKPFSTTYIGTTLEATTHLFVQNKVVL